MTNIVGGKNWKAIKDDINEYKATLDLQVELNEYSAQERANHDYLHDYNLLPPPREYPNREQQLREEFSQHGTALSHIQEIIPNPSQAIKTLSELREANEIPLFLQRWAQFKSFLSKKGPINARAFLHLWDDFLSLKAQTIQAPQLGETHIGYQDEERTPMILANEGSVPKNLQSQMPVHPFADQYVRGEGVAEQDLLGLDDLEERSQPALPKVKLFTHIDGEPTDLHYVIEKEIYRLERSSKEVIDAEFESCLTKKDGVNNNSVEIDFYDGPKAIHMQYSYIKNEWKRPGYKDKIAYIINRKFQSPPTRLITYRKGVALKSNPGIEDRLKPLGAHCVDMPCLFNNYLSVRTKNGNFIHDRPMQEMSKTLTEIIQSLLDGFEPSESQYQCLGAGEQKLFDDLMEFTGYPLKNRHESKQLQRYKVLRGELIAGNDSHELLSELQALAPTLRSKLSKKEYMDVMLFRDKHRKK